MNNEYSYYSFQPYLKLQDNLDHYETLPAKESPFFTQLVSVYIV